MVNYIYISMPQTYNGRLNTFTSINAANLLPKISSPGLFCENSFQYRCLRILNKGKLIGLAHFLCARQYLNPRFS